MKYYRLREGLPIPADARVQGFKAPGLAVSVPEYVVGLEYRGINRLVLVPEHSEGADKKYALFDLHPGLTPADPMVIWGKVRVTKTRRQTPADPE